MFPHHQHVAQIANSARTGWGVVHFDVSQFFIPLFKMLHQFPQQLVGQYFAGIVLFENDAAEFAVHWTSKLIQSFLVFPSALNVLHWHGVLASDCFQIEQPDDSFLILKKIENSHVYSLGITPLQVIDNLFGHPLVFIKPDSSNVLDCEGVLLFSVNCGFVRKTPFGVCIEYFFVIHYSESVVGLGWLAVFGEEH